MRLTIEQYQRGFVRWDADVEASVVISPTNDANHLSASDRMTDANGSVPSQVPQVGHVIIVPEAGAIPVRPVRVSWDRLTAHGVAAMVMDTEEGLFRLADIPGLGRFERLVVSVPYIDCPNGTIFRVGDILVRFVDTLVVDDHRLESAQHDGTTSTFVTRFGSQTLDGSLLEIVVPAELNGEGDVALAILGLAALVFGDVVVGDIVHRSTMASAAIGTEIAVRFPLGQLPSAPNLALRMPVALADEALDRFDALVARLLDDANLKSDVLLPLRWYERSVRTVSPVDRFLTAYLGMEALIKRTTRDLPFASPISELLADPELGDMLQRLRQRYPKRDVDRLQNKLQDRLPKIGDRFDQLAARLDLEDGAGELFSEQTWLRNEIAHGDRSSVSEAQADAGRALLERLLRARLATQ